jgi:hypothetical protein
MLDRPGALGAFRLAANADLAFESKADCLKFFARHLALPFADS